METDHEASFVLDAINAGVISNEKSISVPLVESEQARLLFELLGYRMVDVLDDDVDAKKTVIFLDKESEPMTAPEARELAIAHAEANEIIALIILACKKGERSIKAFFSNDSGKTRRLLADYGYALRDISDENPEYHGTTVSW